ncbi:hypothetical protein ABXN37_19680 [Piscinibacter sakaiensis]|uniref:hypothetical protein n=1 Tax=Piscinibacter sakaiensis TaxID=1547922 RepID=UPI003728A67E
MNAPMPLAEVRQQPSALALQPDTAVDMFTERGFALANRIAKAYASSDAVPAQFRLLVMKKVNGQDQWIENPGAIGNCIVAIEVARAVGMSITAVMQNADMIEGKLRWSGKFVIAAINASGRFTPLRFNMRPLGRIKATYQEKTGWDNQARRPTFATREVEIDDVECIAWALPRGFQMPPGVYNLDQARQHNLPIIESAPVTLSLAVEEGWYAKPGSKWRTGLAPLMFQYRAGSFFGNIHAPDIVMGMGPTSEEARDTQVYDLGADGTVDMSAPISAADLRQPTGVRRVDPQTGEIVGQQAAPAQAAAAPPPKPRAQRTQRRRPLRHPRRRSTSTASRPKWTRPPRRLSSTASKVNCARSTTSSWPGC